MERGGGDSDGARSANAVTPGARIATYRVQLRAEFDFAAAAAQARYLARLGVSHVYCSPYLQAAAGSTHGYDVVDPTRLNEDLGGDAGHRAMCEAFDAHGLRQLLDIVPNHMSIADRRNRWWWDVLADGRSSPYAAFFDIDWQVDERRLRHRVLLPVLGDQIGLELEAGTVRIVREDGALLVAYGDRRYPLTWESIALLLMPVGAAALDDVVDAVAAMTPGVDGPTRRTRFDERRQAGVVLERALADPAVTQSVDRLLGEVNAHVGSLDRLLGDQHHRLARWQVATEEVNYRRFFDINTLVAVRMEDPEVFAEGTALIADLVMRGDVDGLRIDHIDGLRRPLQYAEHLRALTGSDTWLLAEKILQRGEEPPQWALDGTSGYDFLAAVNALYVDPDGRDALTALHQEVTGESGESGDFTSFALAGKREILATTLVSDVERLTGYLATICDAYPAHRDYTRRELRQALTELVAAFPVYRTYVDPRTPPASPSDTEVVRRACEAVRANAPHVDTRLLDFIAELFLHGESHDVITADEAMRLAQGDLVLRLQQLCAAVMAKGVEDTACYRQTVLVALNEVGDSPENFRAGVEEFHEYNARVQRERPQTLLATSTHDTKRSEDVRCRIDLLSEVPGEWASCVRRWRAMNQVHQGDVTIDSATEYLLYQTLVGAWPLTKERAAAYADKAAHEAKLSTSWLAPDDAYDAALRGFVEAILGDERFVGDLAGFVATLVEWGRINSLSMTLLKLCSPGIPDVYQGCELWDLSLVDPDNRRPVDYALRASLLDAYDGQPAAQAWAVDPDSGAPKLVLIRDALRMRLLRPEAFDVRGTYTPMRAVGAFADDVVAFTRGATAPVVVIAQRRALRRRGTWGDTMLQLPPGAWRNVCDGASVTPSMRMQDLLAHFPVALLERTA